MSNWSLSHSLLLLTWSSHIYSQSCVHVFDVLTGPKKIQIMLNMLEDRQRLYFGLAFAAGILLTLGYKDLYPDLERRFRSHNHWYRRRFSLPYSSKDHIHLEDRSDHDPEEPSPSAAREFEIKEGIEGTIGNTPLIKIKSLSDYTGCEILAKAEFLNGAGNSPKDRVALNMIVTAEEEGLLVPGRGDCIYEGTVGSTGISLAAIARARGYRAYMYVDTISSSSSPFLLPQHSHPVHMPNL